MTEREEISRELAERLGVRLDAITGRWFTWGGELIPEPVKDALVSREMRVRELLAALQAINDGAPVCDCEHLDENCCLAAGEYCAYCISGIALKSEGRS